MQNAQSECQGHSFANEQASHGYQPRVEISFVRHTDNDNSKVTAKLGVPPRREIKIVSMSACTQGRWHRASFADPSSMSKLSLNPGSIHPTWELWSPGMKMFYVNRNSGQLPMITIILPFLDRMMYDIRWLDRLSLGEHRSRLHGC